MYADDIVIFSNNSDSIQKGLVVPSDNCQRWKFTVTTEKKKMKFERQEIYIESCILFFKEIVIEIVSKFVYLGITFSTAGAFTETHKTLSGQGLKAIFTLSQVLYKFIT